MKRLLLLFLTAVFLVACGQPNTEINEKETLVIGLYPIIFDRLRNAIFDFNKNNPLYYIEVKEYEDSGQLIIDITTDKAPDIILLPSHFMMNIYADKGVFVDLYPFLDNDSAINRIDLQENILEAYEISGQLLGMPINYVIDTVATARSNVGEIYSWNLNEIFEFADKQLPESNFFQNHSKSAILNICLAANGDVLIDWNNGGIFNRDLFFKILNFSDRFIPDTFYSGKSNIFEQIEENHIIFFSRTIGSIILLQIIQHEFSEQVAFPGFPAEVGSGNIAHSEILLAINQKCSNQEVAWSFISSLLTEKFQVHNSGMYLPIRKSALESHLSENKKGSWLLTGTDIVFDFYPATEEEKQQMRDLIASVTKTRKWDMRIEDILYEEAQTFLNGFKSAEEAANIAANRIEIYINELYK